MNASDYLYAVDKENASCIGQSLENTTCRQNNWMFIANIHQWTINANLDYDNSITRIHLNGSLYTSSAGNEPIYARPVIHLKEDIKIISGDGSQETPFIVQ